MSTRIVHGEHPDFKEVEYTGYCIKFGEHRGLDKGGYYCLDKEYLFGSEKDLQARILELLEPESMDDLRDGKYSITVYNAFKDDKGNNDYDASEEVECITFLVKKKIEVVRV